MIKKIARHSLGVYLDDLGTSEQCTINVVVVVDGHAAQQDLLHLALAVTGGVEENFLVGCLDMFKLLNQQF